MEPKFRVETNNNTLKSKHVRVCTDVQYGGKITDHNEDMAPRSLRSMMEAVRISGTGAVQCRSTSTYKKY
jgi:hypothetical protein